MTVGSGFRPDLLTPHSRALAGSVDLDPPYRRWGLSPRPEVVVCCGDRNDSSM